MTLIAAGIIVAAALGLKLLALALEPRLTFMPLREIPFSPADLGLPFEDAWITTEDGLRIHGWFIPGREAGRAAGGAPGATSSARAVRAPLTLLFFHGNAENIALNLPLARITYRAGYNLLMVDYRGYGKSVGSPSETGIYRDGKAAFRYLLGRSDVDPARIVVWGRSIGAAVAVRVAAAAAPAETGSAGGVAGVILESPFTSALELLRDGGYWLFYPLALLGSYRFDQTRWIGRIDAPICVVHGTRDEVVPFRLGRRLFDLAPGKKDLVAIEGGGHNDLLASHADELWSGVSRFLASLE